MTDITNAKTKMQVEESDFGSALSEAYFQKSGANLNYLSDHMDTAESNIGTNETNINSTVSATTTNSTNISKINNLRSSIASTTANFVSNPNQYLQQTIVVTGSDGGTTFNVTTDSDQLIIVRSSRPLRMVQLRAGSGSWGGETNFIYDFVSSIRSVSSGGAYTEYGPFIEYYVDFRNSPNVTNYIHLECSSTSAADRHPSDSYDYTNGNALVFIRATKQKLDIGMNLGQ